MKHRTAVFLLWLALLPAGAFSKNPHPHPSANTFEARIREAELAGDRDRVAAICREWYASGQYSTGMLNWNYNALMSVEENAVLFTHNESDTYPALLLQYALGVRPDVTLLNIQLLENQGYRDWIVRSRHLEWIPVGASFDQFVDRLLSPGALKGGAPYVPAYFGVMSSKDLLRTDKEKMYLTGLALKFSVQPFDNVAVLRYNYENRFRTDYLALNFEPESQPEAVAQMNLNYVPAFSLLHRHYTASGESAKASHIETLARGIGQAGHREAEVGALFGAPPAPTPPASAITPKALDKAMKKIGDKLYAGETEVTNSQYELFLQDLLRNKDFDILEQCHTRKTDWRALLPEAMRTLPDAVIYKNTHPDAPEAPVENITHAAAQQYCAWITQVYNSSPAKKKFKKVLFRLPTQDEWTLAASGGFKNEPYPWRGGYYVRNAKGCYLCNLNATEPCGDCPADKAGGANDGGFFPVLATSYFPNEFGLYNVSGNVAEMLGEPGKTMGGSWQDIAYKCQIRTVSTYTEPSPAVGFRVFMEVIEE